MKVKKEYREKDAIGAYGLTIIINGNPEYVEGIIDIINEGFSNRFSDSLEEV